MSVPAPGLGPGRSFLDLRRAAGELKTGFPPRGHNIFSSGSMDRTGVACRPPRLPHASMSAGQVGAESTELRSRRVGVDASAALSLSFLIRAMGLMRAPRACGFWEG